MIIYTRTIGVHMNKLNEAMEIAKEQAAIQKEHSGVEVYVSFQMGGNPRTIRWMTIGEMDKLMEADAKFSADPRMIASLKRWKMYSLMALCKMKCVMLLIKNNFIFIRLFSI